MQQGTQEQQAHRTRVYIDGYNLYYGCLKNSSHKWLDVHALVKRILANVSYELNGELIRYRFQTPAIKYFTADVLKAFAKSEDSIACQAHYHTALASHLGTELQIIKGYFDARPARAPKWEEGKAARECEKIEVWKVEEKQSDVTLALHAYRDVARGEIDQVVFVTNDTDLEPAMKMIRQDSQATIGLIAPIRSGTRKVNTQLEKHAHWTRRQILDEEFEQSHLPPMVRHLERAIHKPLSWYPRPDLLEPIFEEAKRVRRSAGAARKWLNQPCAHLDHRVPIDMCSAEETAKELRDYMDGYAKDFGV
jgi:6-hydroxy-3-succinoylpyridine 3-monooxygenase